MGLNLTDYIVQAGEQLIVRLAQLHELEVQQLERARDSRDPLIGDVEVAPLGKQEEKDRPGEQV